MPSDLASRTRHVWQYHAVPALSGLLPTLPTVPWIRLPPASPGRCDDPAVAVSHPHTITRRLVAHPAVLAFQPGEQPTHIGAGPGPGFRAQEPAPDQLLDLGQFGHPPGKIHHTVIITARPASAVRDTPRAPLQY
jgi:hypothetical protein